MAIERGTVWVVANNRGNLITSTVAPLRTLAIKRLVGPEDGWQKSWRWWTRNHGCRCIRVRLVPADGGE